MAYGSGADGLMKGLTMRAIVALVLTLVSGCSTMRPATPTSDGIRDADDAPTQAVDVNAMPADQRKSVLDWVDYVCSLAPEKRADAMKAAPPGYVLITAEGNPTAATDGPTMAFTCPH